MRNTHLIIIFITGFFSIQGSTLLAQLKKDRGSSTTVGTVNGNVIKSKGTTVNGDVVTRGGTKNVYTINNNTKGESIEALSVGKYLNLNKEILVIAGSNKAYLCAEKLEKSGLPFKPIELSPEGETIMSLKLVKGKLKLTADIDDFEGKYIAKVRDNKLILAKNYHRHTSDRYFEIYDDYYIPVLQIELLKDSNAIVVNGVFHNDDGCYIFSDSGMKGYTIGKDKTFMQPQEKERFLKMIREKAAEFIKPIHE
ncbi:hypothetical protein SAMN04488505_102745 [Chitinophaga rupis]|uniref:Uncharacterized protein n=1 Tax=Chitinophaga rupis TaxID=573321 RepID=A0A1H7RVG4_9BACT|nr:hypothetical protein [Chitinophaga rupis]SEL64270.1 hypothetical protein SAMN04488505_102745 [Chitinophaga rupis]